MPSPPGNINSIEGPLGCFVLFEHCAVCRSCCHIEPGYPPLEVVLLESEKQTLGSVCMVTQCEHLGPQGCTLGAQKPLGCELYPLTYDPHAEVFHFDQACPLMPEYQRQLSDPLSEASAHLARMTARLQAVQATEPGFLHTNFAADSDYFELKPLVPPPRKRKPTDEQ